MPHLQSNGLNIHFEEAGAGTTPLVLVHGNFGSWRWWQPVFDRLPAGMKAWAPSLRGCGTTAEGAPDFSIPRLAEDLREFISGVRLRRVHLVGHSLGGCVALQLALTAPELLSSLTLIAPGPPTGLAGMREANTRTARKLKMIDPDHAPSMAAMYSMYQMSRVLGTHRRLLRSSLVEMMPTAQLDPTQFEELLADAAAMPAESLVGFLRGLHQWNVEQQLGQVRIPTLLVWGGKDRLIPGHTMERMAESIPGCQRVFWEDVGHSPQFERPDELADTLFNFVRRGTLGLRIQWMLRQMLDARKRSRARSLRAGGT